MKKILLLLALFIGACSSNPVDNEIYEDANGNKYIVETLSKTIYQPVYFNEDSITQKTKIVEPREMKETGKIYMFKNYILINEVDKGIHVVDNTNPLNPTKVAFIEIPGNVDMAIRDSILYADSYNSLLAMNINDLSNTKIEKVINGVFNRSVNTWNYINYDNPYEIEQTTAPEGGLLVAYDSVRTEAFEQKKYLDNGNRYYDIMINTEDALYTDAVKDAGGDNVTGTGGSMARFTIIDKYLYVLSGANIQLIDIEEPASPSIWSKVTLNWDIETIFPYKDKLFVGSSSGMYIMDNSNPSSPELVGSVEHIRSCDPVVATDSLAYVTLRGGSRCGGFTNQLEILDIKDITKPQLIATYPMNGPYGLAVKDTSLFICDGEAGLKVYNVKDSKNIISTDWVKDISTYDVIVQGERCIVISKDGLRQFDITDITDIKELSYFSIND